MTTDIHLTGGELLGPGSHRGYSRAEMHGMGFLARPERVYDEWAGRCVNSPGPGPNLLGGPDMADASRIGRPPRPRGEWALAHFWEKVDRSGGLAHRRAAGDRGVTLAGLRPLHRHRLEARKLVTYYDRARDSIHRNATHNVSAYVQGAL